MKSQVYHFESVLASSGWIDDALISVDENGTIEQIEIGPANSESIRTGLVALPGMVNVHSHAFQRAFAGLSEYRTASQDSFWTWRKLMYEFLLQLNPDDVFIVARQLYLEMLKAGYTWVGEFHYLHNDVSGNRFGNIGEMSSAIIRAAQESGIGLCMLPVLYQRGGFDNSPLEGAQRRFELSNEQFNEVVQFCRGHDGADYRCGIALHSLRAVEPLAGRTAIGTSTKNPVHIHVAEQTKEVDDCISAHGMRSVEFLFDSYEVDENWCLIHATHLSENEVGMIAKSGAVVGLCPTTEANLGDGFFSAQPYLEQNGRISIGSDSHCSVDLRDELRTLEYGQRLSYRSRAMLGTELSSVGRHLYDASFSGGSLAIGLPGEGIQVGARADLTLVDPQHPAVVGSRHDSLIDCVVFTNSGNPIRGTMVGGKLRDVGDDAFAESFAESSAAFADLRRRMLG